MIFKTAVPNWSAVLKFFADEREQKPPTSQRGCDKAPLSVTAETVCAWCSNSWSNIDWITEKLNIEAGLLCFPASFLFFSVIWMWCNNLKKKQLTTQNHYSKQEAFNWLVHMNFLMANWTVLCWGFAVFKPAATKRCIHWPQQLFTMTSTVPALSVCV